MLISTCMGPSKDSYSINDSFYRSPKEKKTSFLIMIILIKLSLVKQKIVITNKISFTLKKSNILNLLHRNSESMHEMISRRTSNNVHKIYTRTILNQI